MPTKSQVKGGEKPDSKGGSSSEGTDKISERKGSSNPSSNGAANSDTKGGANSDTKGRPHADSKGAAKNEARGGSDSGGSGSGSKSPYNAMHPRRRDSEKVTKPSTETPGGYQYTYTGVRRVTPETQQDSVTRLSAYDPERVPDSRRVMEPRVKEICGLMCSYQWTSGGSSTHGFMH